MITAIVPSKDEKTLPIVILELSSLPFLEKIIVVDDGSKIPVTATICKLRSELPRGKVVFLRNEKSVGKNRSVEKALSFVETEYVLLQDADLEYPVLNVYNLVKYLPADVVVARRFVPVDKLTVSGFLANRLITKLVKVPDVFSGQRIVKTKILRELDFSGKWTLETKLTLKCLLKDLKVVYVDSLYYPRSYKEGKKIRPWDMIPILIEVFNFWRTLKKSKKKTVVQDSTEKLFKNSFLREKLIK